MAQRPTAESPQQFSEHGTRQAYEKGFCRCSDCKVWKREENAKKHIARKKRRKRDYARRMAAERRRRGEE